MTGINYTIFTTQSHTLQKVDHHTPVEHPLQHNLIYKALPQIHAVTLVEIHDTGILDEHLNFYYEVEKTYCLPVMGVKAIFHL